MADSGRYCFVADLHLGPDSDPGGERERAFVSFLKDLPAGTEGLYLLGDIFDYWMDYRDMVPRGNVRTLAALAEAAERMEVRFYPGNHDWWVTDYFEKELGVHIVHAPWEILELEGMKVMLGHGDTLGCDDWKSRLIFYVFRNKVCLALLKSLHPRLVFSFARSWAAASRRRHPEPPPFAGRELPIYRFADEFGRSHDIDLYIFGHWHTAGVVDVESGGRMRILGAWRGPGDAFYL